MSVSIIVAFSENFVIGSGNEIPWYIREDLQFFKTVTMHKIVIMGRKTYESIPDKYRPLMGRTTYLLTRDKTYTVDHPDVKIFHEFSKALFAAKLNANENEIMIAGGAEIYKQALPYADRIYATVVLEKFEGDAYFPKPLIEDWYIVDADVVFPFHDKQLDLMYNRTVYIRRTKPYVPLQ